MRALAERGRGRLARGEYLYGRALELGTGVDKDAEAAVRWYRKAAEQGLAFAQNNLGNCYTTGTGVVKDEAEAAKWYRKAAEQGFAGAEIELGDCYANGSGVAKDETRQSSGIARPPSKAWLWPKPILGTAT